MSHHYFATHALGWATAPTRDEAMRKLLLTNTDPAWYRNCLKDGTFLTVYTCRVHGPADAKYRIEWYMPKGIETSEGENWLVTYLTKKAYAVAPDPEDKVRKLEAKLAKLEEEA